MRRDLEKRLEEVEKTVSFKRTQPQLSKIPKTKEELKKELDDAMEEADKEDERFLASSEHKRLMLEKSDEGHRYRRSFFLERDLLRLKAELLKELGGCA